MYNYDDDDDDGDDDPAPCARVPISGVYILPKNLVFYKTLFQGIEFFINNDG